MEPRAAAWPPRRAPEQWCLLALLRGLFLIAYCSLLINPTSGAAVGLMALVSGRLGATMGCIRQMQFQEQQGAAAEPWDIEVPELHIPLVGHLSSNVTMFPWGKLSASCLAGPQPSP